MSTAWATAAREVPGLDHDPTPGDVPATHRLAADLAARGEGVTAGAAAARGWDHAAWRGEGSAQAVAAVAGLAEGLDPLARSLEGAADVLHAWARELATLQDEAAALGLRAQEMRRRHLLSGLVAHPGATPSDVVAEQERLGDERRALQREVDDLHARWLGAARRRCAELDRTAPPARAGWWRGTWDLGHDAYQDQVRREARWLGWTATGTGAASSAVGLVSPALGPLAPVGAATSGALAVTSLQASTHLAVGAGGARRDVEMAAVGVAAAGAGAALGRAAASYGPRAEDLVAKGRLSGDGLGVWAAGTGLAQRRGDGQAPGTVEGLDGGDVEVTVHDVDSPWHVGHGLRGDGFVGVAVVPVVPAVPVVPRGSTGTGGSTGAGAPVAPGAATSTTRPPRRAGDGSQDDRGAGAVRPGA